MNERPDLEEQIDRKEHEVVLANMAAQFLSTVIDLYSNQAEEKVSTEFTNAPTTFHLALPHLQCTCQDDGAAWRRKFDPATRTWINPESTLLYSLGVKSVYFQADSSGAGTTSDSTLAQQFCELLGSVLSQVQDGNYRSLDEQRRSRFLVSVYQSDIMIVSCYFSLDYLSYIHSPQPPAQLPYATLHRSRKYDLGDPVERKEATEAIIALNEYFN